MATAPQPQQQQRREIVEFPPNVPITVSMRYAQPKLVSGQYGERFMYTTADNRIFFLDAPVAARITELGINVRENFSITKRSSGKAGEPVSWEISRIPGEQPNGTMVLPRDPAAEPAPKPPARAACSLADAANELVDTYASVLDRALREHQGRVKPDEVRALLLATYINRAKGVA